jgi:hypothetical protein
VHGEDTANLPHVRVGGPDGGARAANEHLQTCFLRMRMRLEKNCVDHIKFNPLECARVGDL